MQKGIPEFASKSIICLDADVTGVARLQSIVLLPGDLPPDQLIFQYLYNLPAAHPLWTNPLRFNRPVLTRIAAPLMTAFAISGPTVDLKALVVAYRGSDTNTTKLRELFKAFYKDAEFQAFLGQRKSNLNPWLTWVRSTQVECASFLSRFAGQLTRTMTDGYSVDITKLGSLAAA